MKFQTVEEMIDYRNNLTEKMSKNICVVSFLKKDGDTRVMSCTTNPSFIPMYKKKTDRVRPTNAYVFSAFDLNRNAYRSFRLENILDVIVLTESEVRSYVQKVGVS
jgi:hypothetical protein